MDVHHIIFCEIKIGKSSNIDSWWQGDNMNVKTNTWFKVQKLNYMIQRIVMTKSDTFS